MMELCMPMTLVCVILQNDICEVETCWRSACLWASKKILIKFTGAQYSNF